MVWELIVILFIAAVFIGVASSLLGIGGGSFMVPLLLLGGFVMYTRQAVGTSIAAVAFTSLVASYGYLRAGKVDLKIGLLIAPMTVIGGYFGAVASDVLPDDVLSLAFGLFVIYPGIKMLLDKDVSRDRIGIDEGSKSLLIAVFLFGGFVGFVSGLFGIGGGSVMVPVLTMILGFGITQAVATSLFAMFPSAVVASAKQWQQGNLIPEYAVPLILGISIGAYIGPKLSESVPKQAVRRGFGVLLLLLAARMITRGIL